MSDPVELQGTQVVLRPTSSDDKAALVAIRSTDEVRRRWQGIDLDAEFDDDLLDDDVHRLTIHDRDGVVVGLIQFGEEDDPQYRHANIDIYIDPAVHRQGVATDAIETLIAHLFHDRGHHRLTIDPALDNVAAVECYRKAGFRPVGVMREYERDENGRFVDGLLMELLASDLSTPTPPPMNEEGSTPTTPISGPNRQ